MPSGKTHDLITYILAIPTAVAFFLLTRNPGLTLLGTGAMLFSGLMFGPDLDTRSVQYFRWGIFRGIWIPYQRLCGHRSRLSHGILFSTFFRIFYFLAILTAILAITLFIQNIWVLGMPPTADQGVKVVQESLFRMLKLIQSFDKRILILTVAGLWIGAMTHSVSDFLGSTFKSASKFL
ncbi:MAG TPA: metal-binding protein [Acidobacteriota bacterium]|nr:metal-binding protein [Acidobacteriota bacterium]HNJ40956.1 metal-binding protein [Acidobacteriota bacterium]